MSKPVEDYINSVLRERRSEFGGKAVCPFAGPELDSQKLMIAEVGEKNLDELIDEFKASDHESAIFVVPEDIPAEETDDFQIFVNQLLAYKGMREYKNICFNPNDKDSVEGYNPRSLAPGFMVNIASRKVLSKAAKSLTKTTYYDRLPEDYLTFLKVTLPK